MLAREHISTQDTLAREYVSTQDMLAREHVFSTKGTQFRRLKNDACKWYIKNNKRVTCHFLQTQLDLSIETFAQ